MWFWSRRSINNQVDELSLRRLVRCHIEHGTNAIVPKL